MSSNTRSVKVTLSLVLAEVPAHVTPEVIREYLEDYASDQTVWFPGTETSEVDRGSYVSSATVTLVEDVTEADDIHVNEPVEA